VLAEDFSETHLVACTTREVPSTDRHAPVLVVQALLKSSP
jgi:hypothetical protein